MTASQAQPSSLQEVAGTIVLTVSAGPRTATVELATLAGAAPDGDGWMHEVKFDGYRLQAILE